MDGSGHEGSNLPARLGANVEAYEGWEDHVADLPSVQALMASLPELKPMGSSRAFSGSFLVGMLFSCLVDTDFPATEMFYSKAEDNEQPHRGGRLEQARLATVRAHMARHRREDTPVNKIRSHILDHANGKASLPPGLFTLTVPTGGGKTLTSLSFAMEHAAAHDLRRIVYVIPFTSIIEQTAQVFRDEVGLREAVLEHHGGVDRNETAPKPMLRNERRLPRGGVDCNFSEMLC